MKIAFFIRTLNNSGGTERVTCSLANELSKKGFDVYIITWMGGKKSFFELLPDVKVHTLFPQDNVSIYTSYLKTLYRYYQIKKQIDPAYIIDVCVAQSIVSIPINWVKKSRIISWEHFNTTVNWNRITGPISRKLVSRFANRIITLTLTDKLNYEKHYHAKNVSVISNPVTIPNVTASKLEEKRVLTVARFTYQKGLDLLLNIWKIVCTKFPDWKLVIIGDGELKNELLKQREIYGLTETVEILEPTNHISEIYAKTSIYAMPSRFEGMPLVLIEAKNFGIPIVSFDCETGPRDIVKHNEDGILVEPFNIVSFATSLMKLMGDQSLRNKYGNNALSDLERFTLSSFVDKWIDALE